MFLEPGAQMGACLKRNAKEGLGFRVKGLELNSEKANLNSSSTYMRNPPTILAITLGPRYTPTIICCYWMPGNVGQPTPT